MIRLLLFFTLTITSFTYAKPNLTLWHSQGLNEAFWRETVDEFNQQNEDMKVSLTLIPRKELNSGLTEATLVGEAPDMALIQSDVMGLSSYFKLSSVPSDWLGDFTDELMDTFISINNTKLGVPISIGNHLVLYYNKRYISEPAKTWQELIEQRKTLPEGTDILGINHDSSYFFIAFWHAFGDDLVHQGRAALNTKNTIDALNFYHHDNVILDNNCHYSCVSSDFFNGKYAYAINGDWEYQRTKEMLGENLGVALLPRINDRAITSMKSVMTLVFPNNSLSGEKAPLIKKFVEHVKTEQFARSIFDKFNSLPAHKKVRKEILGKLTGNDKIFNQQLLLSKPMTPAPSLIAAWDSISKGLKLFKRNQINAEETAQYMQRSADHELEQILEGF